MYGQVASRLNPTPPIFANSDLLRVAAFLKGLDLFVCVDGGLFHIAVGTGVRTLGLFFKTDPAPWKPPVAWATVLRRPPDDVPISLTSDEVYKKICEMVLESRSEMLKNFKRHFFAGLVIFIPLSLSIYFFHFFFLMMSEWMNIVLLHQHWVSAASRADPSSEFCAHDTFQSECLGA